MPSTPQRLMMGLEVGLGLGLWPMPVVLVGPAPTLAIRKEKIIIVVEECACAVCGGWGRVWRVKGPGRQLWFV